jgi:hypothetical protein
MNEESHSTLVKPMHHSPPLHLVALIAAVGGIIASGFAICTGSLWSAILAILLTGMATLLPGWLDYRRTRQAVEQARHLAGTAKMVHLPVLKQASVWSEPFNHTIH